MADKIKCEIYIAMNEDGDWIVTHDESDALVNLGENIGGAQARVVKITVRMSPPAMTEVEVHVPDESGQTVETTVE